MRREPSSLGRLVLDAVEKPDDTPRTAIEYVKVHR
jgi:hypothetical protein